MPYEALHERAANADAITQHADRIFDYLTTMHATGQTVTTAQINDYALKTTSAYGWYGVVGYALLGAAMEFSPKRPASTAGESPTRPASAPQRTWRDFIHEAQNRVAAAKAKYGVSDGAVMMANGGSSELGESFVPDSHWQTKAPSQVTPGTNRLDHTRISGRTGRVEQSRVIYDQYGRQTYRVDRTDHMRPESHSNPHLHQREYVPVGRNPHFIDTKYDLKK